jgi:hypothetical protein
MNSEDQKVIMINDMLWIQAAEHVSGVDDVIQLTELYKICRYILPTIYGLEV